MFIGRTDRTAFMKKSYFYLLLPIVSLLSCTSETGEKKPSQALHSEVDCSNTLVVSGLEGARMYADNGGSLSLVHEDKGKNIFGGFFDCDTKSLIAPYSYREPGAKGFGVAVTNLESGKSNSFIMSDGMNFPVARYNGGILINTGVVYSKPYDPEDGYIPPKSIVKDSETGASLVSYENTQFFVPTTGKIEKTYEHRILDGEVLGDSITGSADGRTFVKMSLVSGKMEKVFEGELIGDDENISFTFPTMSIKAVLDGTPYYITTNRSYDTDKAGSYTMEKFKPRTIYRVVDGELSEVATLPLEPVLARRMDGKIAVLHEGMGSISFFDAKSRELITKPIPGAPRDEWEPVSFARTEHSYIFALRRPNGQAGTSLLIVDKEFSKASMFDLDSFDIGTLMTEKDFQVH